ncbi:MAG: PAS domain S-box protein, partial [Bacillota bacterium]|nr:PAS domain S-box protein [Bacillota bacterium]
MNYPFDNYKNKVKWTLSVITFLVLLDETASFFIPFNRLFLDSFIFAFGMIILFFMLKGVDHTAEELRKSRQRLENIFDTIDVAIWSHDLKNEKLLITPGIKKLYGYSLEEFYSDNTLWKKVIYPEDLHVLEEREKILMEGKPATSVYRIIRPQGEVRWIQDRGIPTLDQNGNLMNFNSVLFDITDRKESEDRYRSLVEMSPDIIAVYSRERIDYINEAGCKLFGAVSPEQLIGQSIKKMIPPYILQQIKSRELTIDDNFEEKMRFEFIAERLDGKKIEVEMTAMPILYEGRMARQIVGRDISQRKKAEKTIEYMAYYDALTGLPNRNMFRKHLNEALN